MSEKVFEFSSEEELLSLRPELDCPYCKKEKASHGHLLRRHLKPAVHYSENDTDKFTIPCFCSERQVAKRSHWHCPKCHQKISRSSDFRKHLQNHGLVVIGSPTTLDAKDLPTAQDHPTFNHLKCKVCHLGFTNISNLRRHEKVQHDKERQPIICIDAKNGIFVTPKDPHGPRVPVHVCKSVLSQTISCELPICKDFMAIALKSGNPGMECQHLVRTNKALAYTPPPPLAETSIQLMSDRGLISRTAQKECLDMNAKAHSEGIDCVFPVFWDETSISERFMYFSVFTNKKDNWCKFSRTRVTFDSQSGKWHCQCRVKRRASCTHRYLSMWYMFQEHPHFLKSTANVHLEDTDDVEEIVSETEEPHRQCAERYADVIKMTEYLWTHKKIPEDLPHELITKEKPLPESFTPLEEVCPYCPGPCPPALDESRLVTKHGTVYFILSVTKGK
ncbi:uncharacterized protein [Paramormyrops kingsleyae]|uniref:uncharacterized protein n=1 Tax=Paramormyrops kingsleyae TaxID=1676925 RepID=UPI003B975F39